MVRGSRTAAGGQPQGVRFEATVHPPPGAEVAQSRMAAQARVADLDVDRIPDPDEGIRLLVDADECTDLLEQGFEVRLVRAVPVRPLDEGLIADDDAVTGWFEERVREAEQQGGSA